MSTNTELFFKQHKFKKIAFIGMGISNFDSIKLFLNRDINVTVLDKSSKENLGKNADVLEKLGAKFICGDNYLDCLYDFDIVVRSPGVYFNKTQIQKAIKYGTVVTSEMELFFELCPCTIIGITGSDGKTTTTTLITEMLKFEGYNVHVGGNIGKALLSKIYKIKTSDIAVVELSSFQLISMRRSPDIAVITNIAPNHLDVHGTMEEYIGAKQNIILHQNEFGKSVLNLDNELSNSQETLARGVVKKFSRKNKVEYGAFFDESNQKICFSKHGNISDVLDRNDIKIPGIHNVENYLAAITAVFDLVSIPTIKKVAKTFNGVAHRIELIKESGGVRWYNDSIATSPTRTIAGLDSFNDKIILIAGGYDKNLSYDSLAAKLIEKTKALVLMGKTAKKIEQALKKHELYDGNNPIIYNVSNMEEAVELANKISKNGDVVSLSPASASFDLYKNFEERGEHFRSIVEKL